MSADVTLLNAPPSPRELAFLDTLYVGGLRYGQRSNEKDVRRLVDEVRTRRNGNGNGGAWLAVHHACSCLRECIPSICRSLFESLNGKPLATAKRARSDYVADRTFGALAGLAALDLPLAVRLRDRFFEVEQAIDALLTVHTLYVPANLDAVESVAAIVDEIIRAAQPVVCARWGNWSARIEDARRRARTALDKARANAMPPPTRQTKKGGM